MIYAQFYHYDTTGKLAEACGDRSVVIVEQHQQPLRKSTMNITITITNPTVNVLAALAGAHAADNAKMMESLDKASTTLDVLLDEIARAKTHPEAPPVQDDGLTAEQVTAAQYDPVQDAPIITPQPDPQDTALRIVSLADIDNYLDIGTEVHWKGQKFEFDGVVERIETDDVADGEGWIDYDTKVLFLRRNDTGKLVSLNMRDIQTGRLTLID